MYTLPSSGDLETSPCTSFSLHLKPLNIIMFDLSCFLRLIILINNVVVSFFQLTYSRVVYINFSLLENYTSYVSLFSLIKIQCFVTYLFSF